MHGDVIKYLIGQENSAWTVLDEKGRLVARCETERDANIIADALWLVRRMAEDFPGLVDTDTDVGGADLVDFCTHQIHEMDALKQLIEDDAKRGLENQQ